ncbi:MAG: TfoX/Sxy family protein [Ruminococcus flavefaciens]|nr:TfoX/Sxy family protein [Ruminococcus flavefaciens]MCM1361702.1 TfoX/Sxy family protein [Clostridiales bacterium]MCM1435497.1 TfoX/Sxy family protein [Ruminococcus flavefaciens]
MSELTSLKNIGKEIERKLKTVGINSAEELKQIGSKNAFIRLKIHYPEVCLVHLYTLQGAVDDIEYNRLSENTKHELKEFSDELKKQM